MHQESSYIISIDKTNLVFLDESDESRTFDLNGLSRPVVECDDKVKKVGFTQVAWWLFFEMCSTNSQSV